MTVGNTIRAALDGTLSLSVAGRLVPEAIQDIERPFDLAEQRHQLLDETQPRFGRGNRCAWSG